EGLSLQRRARRGHELAAGRIAVVRRLCERCLGDGVEGFGEVLPGIREARWRIVQVREEDGQLTLAVEGPRTGETFVEDAAKRVDVGAPVDRATFDLLERDVVYRAEEAAVTGQAADRRDVARQDEVGDIGVFALVLLGSNV